ncbi:hypothetical protein TcYC6_0066700 [Trypanosoma cruzi]|nr:hypothetical protein TcYC6_0066700 [Trypanosoma cruzi]
MNRTLWLLLVLSLFASVAAGRASTGPTAASPAVQRELEMSHLYCQPISEATPATPMMGRFKLNDIFREVHGKRVRIIDAPWPSVVGKEFWIDATWDVHWVLFHKDSALKVAARPKEDELRRMSKMGLVEGNPVVKVRIIN